MFNVNKYYIFKPVKDLCFKVNKFISLDKGLETLVISWYIRDSLLPFMMNLTVVIDEKDGNKYEEIEVKEIL